MTDKPTPEDIDDRIAALVEGSDERLFEKLDKLHQRNIHDNEVVRSLRKLDYGDVAARYLEWSGALDPDIVDDLNTMNPAVPDPIDADGNRQLAEAHTHAGNVQTALEAIKAQLVAEREKELYFNPDYDGESAMLDGPVNLLDLAEAVVKGLGK